MSEVVTKVATTNGDVVALRNRLQEHIYRVQYLAEKRPQRFEEELKVRVKLSKHLGPQFSTEDERSFEQVVMAFDAHTRETPLPLISRALVVSGM